MILEKKLGYRRYLIFLFLISMVFLNSPKLRAEEDFHEDLPEKTSWKQRLINSESHISGWFEGMAEGLDLFLVGKKVTLRENESSIRIGSSVFYNEGEGLDSSSSLGVNLRLPNLEDYFQLKFTSYDESQERGVSQKLLRQKPREKNFGASVGLFRKLDRIRVSFQPRIALQDPLKVSHSLAFESLLDLKIFEFNPRLEFFADPDKGTGIFEALNFNFQLDPIFSFTLINEGEYQDKSHIFSTTNGFSLGQMVTERSGLSYNLLFFSKSRSQYHLSSYSLSVAWSHAIYKKTLDYQVVPHLDFAEERSFKGVSGLALNVGLNF